MRMSYEDFARKLQIAKDRRILDHEFGKIASRRIVSAMERHWEALEKSWPRVEKRSMRFQRVFAIHVLALYRALGEELAPGNDLLAITERVVWMTHPTLPFKILNFVLTKSKNPLRLFRRILSLVLPILFPKPPYDRTGVLDLDDAMGVDFTRCPPYCDFFASQDAPELTIVACNMDWHWMELIQPLTFERELCMGKGDTRCEFRWHERTRTNPV